MPIRRRSSPVQVPPTVSPALSAREYSEAWYACLREPETAYVPHLATAAIESYRSSRYDLDMGHWRSNGGQVYWRTPAGWRDERAIGKAVFGMLESSRPDDVLYGKLLGRVITGVGVASLCGEQRWAFPRERSIRYALACLTLAVQVGDTRAEGYLAEVRQML